MLLKCLFYLCLSLLIVLRDRFDDLRLRLLLLLVIEFVGLFVYLRLFGFVGY